MESWTGAAVTPEQEIDLLRRASALQFGDWKLWKNRAVFARTQQRHKTADVFEECAIAALMNKDLADD